MSRIISNKHNSTLNVIKKVSNMHFFVVFDANGGICDSIEKDYYFPESAYDSLPIPTRDGYKFTGWFTEKEHGHGRKVLVSDAADINAKILYAHWVKLNLDGGVISSSDHYAEADMNNDMKWNSLPAPTKGSNFFAGWYANEEHVEHNIRIYETSEIDDTVTDLYAHFMISGTMVTFNPMGGTCDTASREYAPYEPYSDFGLPIPVRSGYVFDGWYSEHTDDETGETIVDFKIGLNMSSRVPIRDFIVYAHWIPYNTSTSPIEFLNASVNALYLKNTSIDAECLVFDKSTVDDYYELTDEHIGSLALSNIYCYDSEADASVLVCEALQIITEEMVDLFSQYEQYDSFQITSTKIAKQASQLDTGDVIADDITIGDVLFEVGHIISVADILKFSGNIAMWYINGGGTGISTANYSTYGKDGVNVLARAASSYGTTPRLSFVASVDGNISFSYRGDGTYTAYYYIQLDAWYSIDGKDTKFVTYNNSGSGNLTTWQSIAKELPSSTVFDIRVYTRTSNTSYHRGLYLSDIVFTPSVPIP